MYVSNPGFGPLSAPGDNDGFLSKKSKEFDDGVSAMTEQLKKAEEVLKKDPSNPGALADYQAKLSEYNLYRNAQSNSVKAYKDTSSAIVSNFR